MDAVTKQHQLLCATVFWWTETVPVATRSFQTKTGDITAIGQTNVSCWSVPQLHNKFPVIWQAHRRISLSGFPSWSHVVCSPCIPMKDHCYKQGWYIILKSYTGCYPHPLEDVAFKYLTNISQNCCLRPSDVWLAVIFFLSLLFGSQLSNESFHYIPHHLRLPFQLAKKDLNFRKSSHVKETEMILGSVKSLWFKDPTI